MLDVLSISARVVGVYVLDRQYAQQQDEAVHQHCCKC